VTPDIDRIKTKMPASAKQDGRTSSWLLVDRPRWCPVSGATATGDDVSVFRTSTQKLLLLLLDDRIEQALSWRRNGTV